MDKILEIRQKRAALVKQAREILDAAEAEKRDLTGEEEQKYEAIMADVDKIAKDIEREERMSAIEAELNKSAGTIAGGKGTPGDVGEQRTGRASDEYRKAFWNSIRHGRNALYPEELRALQIGTDSEGGYLVPDEFERTLIQALESQNIMRTLATVITTAGDRMIPVVASHGSAAWISEEGAFNESDESFDRVVLGAYKVGTLIKVSEELLNDSAFNLEQYITNEFARRIGRAEEAAFVNGDGSGKPTGVIGSASLGITAAAGNAITSDEVIDLFHSLSRPYRDRATWLMADSTVKAIRKLKNSVSGDYIWQPGLVAGQPDRILGRPVAISDDVPAIALGAKVIAFGDMSYYWIADRQGTVLQRLNELYAVNGQVGFRGFRRVDGKLTLAEAVKVLQMKAS
ncbi:phage major capsid protein [Mahella australiensis]|uniref:Phage major capsid protein, HK97 family n=1 Tax=Mahella australiensis (strain DSM 15567 / CIP 107919 / 50-1 BON) TaxID=697281 RepID=F4A0H2_MAHA5|nr:phage major capsid protein [Mahella australiensis]AEE98033.1 phage major capsid protein, HK97 family [Mahella australiensis 50-1 BON]